MFKKTKPIVTKEGSDAVVLEHPAFASASVSRVTGAMNLNGSDFVHNQSICLKITKTRIRRELGRVYHLGNTPLVEVYFSESQWATILSSVGQGRIPVTLGWTTENGHVDQIDTIPQNEHLTKDVMERMDKLIAPIKDMRRVLDEQKMTNKAKNAIKEQIDRMERDILHDLPFYIDAVAEHLEKVSDAAKSEIHAHMTDVIMRAGMGVITDGTSPLRINRDLEV